MKIRGNPPDFLSSHENVGKIEKVDQEKQYTFFSAEEMFTAAEEHGQQRHHRQQDAIDKKIRRHGHRRDRRGQTKHKEEIENIGTDNITESDLVAPLFRRHH